MGFCSLSLRFVSSDGGKGANPVYKVLVVIALLLYLGGSVSFRRCFGRCLILYPGVCISGCVFRGVVVRKLELIV